MPDSSSKTGKLPALAMRAAFSPSSINEEARTADLVWTTGEKVLRSNWDGQFWEELSLDPKHVRMDRLQSGRAPFLANHDGRSLDSVIGIVETANIGTCRVRFAKDDPEADKAWNKVRQGILTNVSVGYKVERFEEVVGGDPKTPTYRAVSWTPYEVSLVPMGADSAAHVRSAEPETNECVFETRGEPQEEQRTMSDPTKPAAPAAPSVDVDAVRAEAQRSERERVTGIQTAVRVAKLGDEFAKAAIDSGKDLNAVRELVFEELAKRDAETPTQNQVRVEVTDDASDKFARGVSAALFTQHGKGLVAEAKRKGVSGFEKLELDPGEFRGIKLSGIARRYLALRGIKADHVHDNERLFEMALQARAGYASQFDFPVLLENVMHKQLRASYETQPHSWKRFCGTDSVSDFRDAHRYMAGSLATLPVVTPGTEYQNLELPDGAKVSIQTETRGAIIGIGREMIINDDLGAFVNQASLFGASAALTIEAAVFALLQQNSGLGPTLSDSNTFFHASRGNIGTAAALSAASLDADKVKMRQQQDAASQEYLDLNPRILLVPVQLESSAKILNTSSVKVGGSNAEPNPANGMFGDIVSSPRLTSATRRWMFTEGKQAFMVVFLDGGSGESVTLSSQEGFRRDGVEWKARIEAKVCPFDPKTALTNAGA